MPEEIKQAVKEIAALALRRQERQRVQGFEIKSPYCGRDENGVFHCVCGKCRPLRKQSDD